MDKAYIEHKIKYLNRKRDILFFQIDEHFDIDVINSMENIECRIFDEKYLMIRYLEKDKAKINTKKIIRYNYECVLEDRNYVEAIRLLLKYISMCDKLVAQDIYQVGKMYLNIKNYQVSCGYLLLASILCECQEYSDMYQYCLSKLDVKREYKKDLIDSDKLNLIINDLLLNIGSIDEIIEKYELTEDEKLMVKIYLVQELYKYGDKKRADKIILDIKRIDNKTSDVNGLLEYTEKNRAILAKKKKRILSQNKD